MGLGKRYLWERSQVGHSSLGGGVAHMLDACLPLLGYQDAPKTPAGLMHWFKELYLVHFSKK